MYRLQSPIPAAAPCLLQAGGENGFPLHPSLDGKPGGHRAKREGKSLGTPHEAHLWVKRGKEKPPATCTLNISPGRSRIRLRCPNGTCGTSDFRSCAKGTIRPGHIFWRISPVA